MKVRGPAQSAAIQAGLDSTKTVTISVTRSPSSFRVTSVIRELPGQDLLLSCIFLKFLITSLFNALVLKATFESTTCLRQMVSASRVFFVIFGIFSQSLEVMEKANRTAKSTATKLSIYVDFHLTMIKGEDTLKSITLST